MTCLLRGWIGRYQLASSPWATKVKASDRRPPTADRRPPTAADRRPPTADRLTNLTADR
jgi:hypothetical protein